MKLILHGHHDRLISVFPSLKERIRTIKTLKPLTEQATRLRLIRELTEEEIGRLPEVIREAIAALLKADIALLKAHAAWQKAAAGLHEVVAAWEKTDDALSKVNGAWQNAYDTLANNALAMATWHKSVCVSDCPWNGKTIFPESEAS